MIGSRSNLLAAGLAVLAALAARPSLALTIDARAASQLSFSATRVSGRVIAAVSERAAGGALFTRVVLADESGREVAHFVVPGGREGRVQWVAEGAPAFVVGERVDVALTPAPFGLTVALSPDGESAVRRLAPSSTGVSGETFGRAAAGSPSSVPSTVIDLSPTIGGAVPDDPELVTVRGVGFGSLQLDSRVTFQGLFERVDAQVVSWSDEEIVCRVPHPGLKGSPQVFSGSIKVWTAAGGWSDGDPYVGGPRFSVLYQWAGDSWPIARLPVAIYVNPEGSPFGADLGAMVEQAASQWNVPGAYARLVYRGLTAVQGGNHYDPNTPRDGRNTVVWHDAWAYQPAFLAITWSSIDTLTYEREEVELEINGTRPWTVDPEGEPDKFDLPSTLTHEFGHWLRLGHTQYVASVMTAFTSPGERRRQISVGDSYGASWIHPSYGVAEVPAQIASGATLEVPVTALDREGKPRVALFRGVIELRAVPVPEGAGPGPLDPPLATLPSADVNADANTDLDGRTTATLAGLPDGLYRVETVIENRFVRPAALVRVGAAPVPIVPALALTGVSPQPLVPGAQGRVRFTLPASADVTLDLYDARGRRVRQVASGHLGAGPHEAALDVMGADGRQLDTGVYFLRLAASAGTPFAPRTSRVVILR